MRIEVHLVPDGTFTATLREKGENLHTTQPAATPEQARQLAIDWLSES